MKYTDIDKELDSLCEDEFDDEWYEYYLSLYYDYNWCEDD